jgi:hypothetical protein
MDHFYQTLTGWCDFADFYADVVAHLPDRAHVVEVGVWQGQSTACLAVEILNSGKAIRLDCVDHFKGSTEIEKSLGAIPDLRERFEAAVKPVRHAIREVHAERSVAASKRYKNGSLDFVFIDAAHDTTSVIHDLAAWWPKIKPGGILAGHDADWPSVQKALKPWGELIGLPIGLTSRAVWTVTKPAETFDRLTAPAGERKCLVSVCSNERSIYRQTVNSLMTLGWGQRVTDAAKRHGFSDVQFSWSGKYVLVSDLRNEAVNVAKAQGCSHILFLDADMTWPADVLSSMLAHHDKGIVSGLYFLKSWPHWPVALKNPRVNPKTLAVDYDYDHTVLDTRKLLPQALVGMGCTIVPVALFDALSAPWFEYQTDPEGRWTITEDVMFCQRAAAIGCPIAVDPAIKCGHVGQQQIVEPWFQRALVEMEMLQQQGRTA